MPAWDLASNYSFIFIGPTFKIPPNLALILENFVLLVCFALGPLGHPS
jgi:hypothetical protein